MKANELRIGNLIKWVDKLPEGDCRVTGLAEHAMEVECQRLPFQGFDTDFEGIPLTEDWLLKFGFECTDQQSWSTGEEVNYKVYKKGDLTYNSIQKAWWLRGIMNHYPQYVHQLQNLTFSLTGSELTIKI